MNKLKALSLLFIASISIISCDNDETTDMNVSKSDKSTSISDIAIDFVQGVTETDNPVSRAINALTIESIKKVPLSQVTNLPMTRSASDNYETDTIVAASLSNSKGTVVLIKDDINILPIAYFKKENGIDIEEALTDTTSDLSFLLQSTIDNAVSDNVLKSATNQNNIIVERLAPKCKVSWHQRSPYNRYCFTSDGKQAVAGCVAIAGAQALSVLQPKMSMITSWDEVIKQYPTEKATDEIARMVSYIGKQTGMKYGVDASGTKADKLVSLFSKYGISNYGGSKIINVLKTNHGVIVISGYRAKHGWGTWKHYVDGHAFIADGYVKYNRQNDPYYLHLNYGWGTYYNKEVYLLSSRGRWVDDEARQAYGIIYPHEMKFFSCTYPIEKKW